jgi:NTP pyrophosphatase (non-canonical NTP hydrolase)
MMMTLDDYQMFALRTMADQDTIRVRNFSDVWAMGVLPEGLVSSSKLASSSILVQIDNASRGMGADVGEVLTCVQRCLEYGKPLDGENLKEELGDVLWRIAQVCDALNCTLGEIAHRNIAKLKVRYPAKFSDHLADETNRNREQEARAMEQAVAFISVDEARKPLTEPTVQTGAGWAEPPDDCCGEQVPTSFSVTVSDGAEGTKYQDPDYQNRCKKCQAPIHRSNLTGYCGSCYPSK